MTTILLEHYLILSAILFALGVFGIFINRKSILTLLMCLELSLLAINITLVAFGAAHDDLKGQVISIFVLTIAAAEVAVGLAILTALFKIKKSVHIDDIAIKRGHDGDWHL